MPHTPLILALILCGLLAGCCSDSTPAAPASTANNAGASVGDAGASAIDASKATASPLSDKPTLPPTNADGIKAGAPSTAGATGEQGAVADSDSDEVRCEDGDAAACGSLGRRLLAGEGVKKNATRARFLMDRACAGGALESCVDLGINLMGIEGGPRMPREARKVFQKACDGSAPRGCFELAGIYSTGDGASPDQAQALRMYLRACRMGHAESCDLAK